MFNSKDNTKNKANTRTMERNVIAKQSKFTGDVVSEGDFRIDGTLEGNLKTNGRVVIGPEGKIDGTITCTNADIEGFFSGKLAVSKILTIKATATISGEVTVGKLSIEPGATFNATCAMQGAIKQESKKNDSKKA